MYSSRASFLVILHVCLYTAGSSLYVPSSLPPRALSSLWFPPGGKNLSTIDPTMFMEEKSKFLNSLFSSLPSFSMNYADPKSTTAKMRSVTEEPSKLSSSKFGEWIFLPSLNNEESTVDKSKDVQMSIKDESIGKPLKALRSILSAITPSLSKDPVSYVDEEMTPTVSTAISRDRILTSISKELSSLKDDMLNTAAEMQMTKPKKSFFGPYSYMKPVTPAPLQEKMDVLNKAYDALTKMETDITSGYDISGTGANNIDATEYSQKLVRSVLEAMMPTVQSENSLDKPKRDVNEAFQSVYHNLEEDSGLDSINGINQDGRNRMKLCHHHHHY